MSKKIVIEEGYAGYVFLGWAKGQFDTDDGKRSYFNMYVVSPVSDYSSEDYEAKGWKAEKKSCIGEEVWKDLNPGDPVKLFFDDKKRVVMAVLDGPGTTNS